MQAPRYQDIIQQPHLLREVDLTLLKSWAETYPQVPLFRALLAAKGMQEGDSNAANWLETAAIYASDRRQLKRLIQVWESEVDGQSTMDHGNKNADNGQSAMDYGIADAGGDVNKDRRHESDSYLTEDGRQETTNHENTEDRPSTIDHENVDDLKETGDGRLETKDEKEEYDLTKELDLENLQMDLVVAERPAEDGSSVAEESGQDIYSPATDEVIESELAVVSIETTQEEISENDFQETPDAGEAVNEPDGSATIGQWSADDIDFLRTIGKWEEEAIAKESSVKEEEWIMEAPGKKIHVLKLTDIIDQGLVQTDIRWLAPWLEDFQFSHTPSQPVRKQTEPVVEVVAPKTPDTPITTASVAPASALLTEERVIQKEDVPSETLSSTHSFEEWLTILAQKQKSDSADAPIFDLPQADMMKGISDVNSPESNFARLAVEETASALGEEEVKKMAEESISVRDEMATETLARIYVKQGKISHALKVYEILIQKYPEKSSYFAAQIQQLKAE